jgi:hypothetical protein
MAIALLKYESEDSLEIDLKIIKRLIFYLQNNQNSLWREQIVKTLGRINNK